mmetsp:Transcript_3396/g.4628  ORF Transcript_3396/g.4628 Transcript_3396/m.4628 type:complete len:246 (+) Transcript_3396:229-966(+)
MRQPTNSEFNWSPVLVCIERHTPSGIVPPRPSFPWTVKVSSVLNSPNESGMLPLNSLLSTSKSLRRTKSPKKFGTVPVTSFSLMVKVLSTDSELSVEGIGPVMKLFDARKISNLVKAEIDRGMLPTNPQLSKSISRSRSPLTGVKPGIFPPRLMLSCRITISKFGCCSKSSGIPPVKSLSDKSRKRSLRLIENGIVPLSWLSDAPKYSRLSQKFSPLGIRPVRSLPEISMIRRELRRPIGDGILP